MPFLFLDTDTLITATLPACTSTSPAPPPPCAAKAPGRRSSFTARLCRHWKSLYDRFGLDFASSLDLTQPDEFWRRYLYFKRGWFFHESPTKFGARFLSYAREIRDNRPPELVCQEIYPWLDQIALPLVIHSFGGGRPGAGLSGWMATSSAITGPFRSSMPKRATGRFVAGRGGRGEGEPPHPARLGPGQADGLPERRQTGPRPFRPHRPAAPRAGHPQHPETRGLWVR